MVDHFATLDLARSPWPDPDLLKQNFLRLSGELHPDKAGPDKSRAEAQFRALNEAHNTLRNTRARLLHLLELEGTARPGHVEGIPPAALEFFTIIAETTKKAEVLLKEKALAQSPMLKVQFFEKALEAVEALQQVQARVQKSIAEVESTVRRLAVEWENGSERRVLFAELQKAAAALGFLERWNAQLQEKATALTFF